MRPISRACLALLCLSACNKADESVPPGEGYGCVTSFNGTEQSCTELEGQTTLEERKAFGEACGNERMKSLKGRVVRHCPAEAVVAECALPAERASMRYYKKDMSSQGLKGAAIGCKARGGTFVETP
ncbi:MAG: hypothetical protein HYZ29_15030 [Myxococcales bacterium]|nr:hypothetical protein [Myxococcales bacterium]